MSRSSRKESLAQTDKILQQNPTNIRDIKAFGYVLNREIGMDKVVNILDFGVGTGFISGVLLNEGYENITGIDINENMLDKASKNLKNTNVKLIQADGFHLPFQEVAERKSVV